MLEFSFRRWAFGTREAGCGGLWMTIKVTRHSRWLQTKIIIKTDLGKKRFTKYTKVNTEAHKDFYGLGQSEEKQKIKAFHKIRKGELGGTQRFFNRIRKNDLEDALKSLFFLQHYYTL
jgi:hypothetical protein